MKLARFFINSVGFVLLSCATAAAISNWATGDLVQPLDPALGIPRLSVSWIFCGISLAVALICLFGQHALYQLAWTAWFSTAVAAYVIGFLWSVGPHAGILFGPLPETFAISSRTAGVLAGLVLPYLLLGSYGLLFCLRLGTQTPGESAPSERLLKISLPGVWWSCPM